MLDLLVGAQKAANTPNRGQLLAALLDNNERGITRVLEQDTEHEKLLGDDFFAYFIGLAASMASRQVWRALEDYGYGLHSLVKHPDEKDNAERGMRLDAWASTFLEPDRLQILLDWGLFGRAEKMGGMAMAGVEAGMVQGTPENFDVLLAHWTKSIQPKETTRARNPCLGKMFSVLHGMRQWGNGGNTNPYPEELPRPEEIERRQAILFEAFAKIHYGFGTSRDWWQEMNSAPPICEAPQAQAGLARWGAAHAQNPFEKLPATLKTPEFGQWGWIAGLLEAGCPLAALEGKKTLAEAIIQQASATSTEIDMAWRALMKQARSTHPQIVEYLPPTLARENAGAAALEAYLKPLSKGERKAFAQAIGMAMSSFEPVLRARKPGRL